MSKEAKILTHAFIVMIHTCAKIKQMKGSRISGVSFLQKVTLNDS